MQTLAGVLLPSASVFLLLLCNDAEVLGPQVNGRKTNMFTAAVVAVLVALSVILTASVLFPGITSRQIADILAACAAAAVLAAGYSLTRRLRAGTLAAAPADRAGRDGWRMPPLALLSRPGMSAGRKIGMSALRLYLPVSLLLAPDEVRQLGEAGRAYAARFSHAAMPVRSQLSPVSKVSSS
jgi:hypothetical protein